MNVLLPFIPIFLLLPPPKVDRIKVQILVDDRFESKIVQSELSRKKLIRIYTGETIDYPLYPLLEQMNENFDIQIIHINDYQKSNLKRLPAFKYGRRDWETFPKSYFGGSCEFTCSFHHQLMLERWEWINLEFEICSEYEFDEKTGVWTAKKFEKPKYGEVWKFLKVKNLFF